MANPEHVAKLMEGPKAWNMWRMAYPVKPDLSHADLRGADLNAALLSSANLSGANLSEACLIGAQLMESILVGADLTRAELYETVFANTDLTNAIGLDSCWHHGPSVIDHPTLAKSGRLSLAFLRGCGLPDTLIEYLPSLLSQPIQYFSCFISYSTKNQEFADRLYADLQSKGVRCWFASHDLQGGKKLHEQIVDAIRRYDRLLLILSESSMESEWVRNEIAQAREQERKENRRVLFPIRLVDFERITAWQSAHATEISEFFIPDFSNWKAHDSYTTAFDRLVKDLKAEEQRS